MNTKVVALTLSGIAMVSIACAVWMYEVYGTASEAISGIVTWFEGKQLTPLFNLESVLLASPYILLFVGLSLLVYFKFRTPRVKPDQGEEMVQFQQPADRVGTVNGGVDLVSADPESATTLMLDDLDFEFDTEQQLTEGSHTLEEPGSGESSDANTLRVDPVTEAKVYAACGRKTQAIELLVEAFSFEDIDHDAAANELITLFGQEMKSPDISSSRKSNLQAQRDEFLETLSKSDVKLSDDTWKRIQPDDFFDNVHHAVA